MMKQWIQKIYNTIDKWRAYHSPYYYWLKLRKYFKRPNISFYCGKIHRFTGFPISDKYLNSLIDIRVCSLGWKTKWNSVRFEWDPYISIVFFKKYQLVWKFFYKNSDEQYTKNLATWEAMLDMIYYNKTIVQVFNEHQWKGKDILITIKDNLTNYSKNIIEESSNSKKK